MQVQSNKSVGNFLLSEILKWWLISGALFRESHIQFVVDAFPKFPNFVSIVYCNIFLSQGETVRAFWQQCVVNVFSKSLLYIAIHELNSSLCITASRKNFLSKPDFSRRSIPCCYDFLQWPLANRWLQWRNRRCFVINRFDWLLKVTTRGILLIKQEACWKGQTFENLVEWKIILQEFVLRCNLHLVICVVVIRAVSKPI